METSSGVIYCYKILILYCLYQLVSIFDYKLILLYSHSSILLNVEMYTLYTEPNLFETTNI